MTIYLYDFCFIVQFVTPHAADFSVVSGVSVCECTISVRIVCWYSPVFHIVKWAPIFNYIYYASEVFIILLSTCNAEFGSGILFGSCSGNFSF